MKNLFKVLFTVALFATFTSCVKKDDFDSPPSTNVDPDLTVNKTLAQIKALAGVTPVKIDSNWIVAGVVIADDKSGNFYKEMVIQDTTAGISISLDQSGYYGTFPIGRRVFIKLKGLHVGKVNENYKIGYLVGGAIDRIPAALINDYFVGGKWGLTVVPRVVSSFSSLTPADLNTIIKFTDVEFDYAETGQAYADVVTLTSVNHNLVECGGSSPIIFRTSGFADFGSATIPCKSGDITAVYQVYNSDQQLLVRNLNDIQLDSARCDGNTCSITYVDIDSIRSLFSGTGTTVPGGIHIKGIVTSDYSTSMFDGKNMTIQDGTAAICVRFASAHPFALGTQLDINVGGFELGEYQNNGWLQIAYTGTYVPLSNAVTTSGLSPITTQVVTLADIENNAEDLESELVKVNSVTINNGTATTYGAGGSSGLPISDGTVSPNVILYTRTGTTGATFANSPTPSSPVSVTGLVVPYLTKKQLQIRNTSDVQ